MHIGHLYKITRKNTGEYYYGIHKGDKFDGYWGSGNIIKKYIKTHGTQDLIYQILVIGDYDYILNLEAIIVNETEILNEKCWNLKTGGYRGIPGIETRKKISQTGLGRKYTKDRNKKIQDTRKLKIKEIGNKISISNTGKIRTSEQCQRISIRKKELMTEECKNQMSQNKKGKKNPSWLGYVQTPDGIFESSMEACKFYNCTDKTIRDRIRSKNIKFRQWIWINDANYH